MTREEELLLIRRVISLEETVKKLSDNNVSKEVDRKEMEIRELQNVNAKLRDDYASLKAEFDAFKNSFLNKHLSELDSVYVTHTQLVYILNNLKEEILAVNNDKITELAYELKNKIVAQLELINGYKADFVTRLDMKDLVRKTTFNEAIIDLKNNSTSIVSAMTQLVKQVDSKIGKEESKLEINKLKDWLLNEFQSNEYVTFQDLEYELEEYQTMLDGSLANADVNNKINTLSAKLENIPTKAEVIDIIRSNDLVTDKAKLYYSSDIIDAKLKELISYDNVVKLINNIYDKDAINNKLITVVSKPELLDLQNKVDAKFKEIDDKLIDMDAVDNKVRPIVSSMGAIKDRQDRLDETIYSSIEQLKEDATGFVKNILEIKVDKANAKSIDDVKRLTDHITRLENNQNNYVTKEMLQKFIREG